MSVSINNPQDYTFTVNSSSSFTNGLVQFTEQFPITFSEDYILSGTLTAVMTTSDPDTVNSYLLVQWSAALGPTLDANGEPIPHQGTAGFTFSVEQDAYNFIPTGTEDVVTFDYTLTDNTSGGTAQETITLDIFGPGTVTPAPRFNTAQKAVFETESQALDKISRGLDIFGTLGSLGQTAWKMGNWISAMATEKIPSAPAGEQIPGTSDVGFANSVVQAMLAMADTVAPIVLEGTNPVLLTLSLSATIAALASIGLAILHNDPPDSNYTQVYTAQPLGFTIPGASAVDQALLTDSNNLLQDTLIMLTSAERSQGAELAGSATYMALQNAALNAGEAQYAVDNQAFAAALNASVQELVTLGVPDATLNGSSLAAAQAYYASVGLSDPFLMNWIKEGVSQVQVQALISAIEAAQPDAPGGSAFTDISNAALQISSATLTAGNAINVLITELYVGYYNRAPDPSGENYWVGQLQGGLSLSQIAQSYSVQTESTNLYSFLASPNTASTAAVDAFIASVYQNLFNRAPDAGGQAYYVQQLQNGQNTVGGTIIAIESGAQGNDLLILNNKLLVGDYFDTQIFNNNVQFSATVASAALAAVTSNASSVTTAEALVNTYVATAPHAAQAVTASQAEVGLVGVSPSHDLAVAA